MAYKVFDGTLSLTQSINQPNPSVIYSPTYQLHTHTTVYRSAQPSGAGSVMAGRRPPYQSEIWYGGANHFNVRF